MMAKTAIGTTRATTRKPRKNKSQTLGGMKHQTLGGKQAARAGGSIDKRVRVHTMHAIAGGIPLVPMGNAKASATAQTSPRSAHSNTSTGSASAPTRAADDAARARVEAIAGRILHNNDEAREAFVALKAVLLTVILDDGRESVEWELDAGDWVLVRVSDYADLEGRGRGDLFPVTEASNGD